MPFAYDYKVEVRNRFQGLDLIESLMNYGQSFVTLYRRQGSGPSPWKRNAKRQKDGILKEELPRSVGAKYATEISGEITPEIMKGWSQSKNNTQLWMGLVTEARSDVVKSNIA